MSKVKQKVHPYLNVALVNQTLSHCGLGAEVVVSHWVHCYLFLIVLYEVGEVVFLFVFLVISYRLHMKMVLISLFKSHTHRITEQWNKRHIHVFGNESFYGMSYYFTLPAFNVVQLMGTIGPQLRWLWYDYGTDLMWHVALETDLTSQYTSKTRERVQHILELVYLS